MRKFVLTFTDCDACTISLAISENLEPLQKQMVKEAAILFYNMYQCDLDNNSYEHVKTLISDNVSYDAWGIDINDDSYIGLCNPSFAISACYEV